MTTPTASETLLLNTHPQQTDLYLSIYQPGVALQCQITGSYSHANQTIDYIAVTTGSYLNIGDYLYQVALIGTTPGGDEKGRTWVRSATATTLRFLESDHINWASGDYVTVLKFTEIIPVFPRIIQHPSNEEDVIFYKVWDIAYTNQNDILGSFINMGCNYAGFRDPASGLAQVYWNASGTQNLLGDNLTYLWDFEGGTPTGSTSSAPEWVTYNTPGYYRTTLSVTSASGRVDKSVRYVSIYDRPGYGSNTPTLNWELMELDGSRESVGSKARIKVRTNVPKSEIKDGALVIIFADEWYGNTKQSIGGNSPHRETIKFVGYIQDGTIQYNYADGWIEFQVVSPAGIMEISECFSCSVESKANPNKWYELKNMTIARAIYHYLAWQSSVLLCCDVEFPRLSADDRSIQYFDADRTSLYDAINTLVSGAMKGRVVSDRQGKLWIERDHSVVHAPTGTFSTVLSIDKSTWIGEPIIDERPFSEVAFIEMGGIAYSGATGTFGAFLAGAPGSAPRYHGKVERVQGLALLDQIELNTMIGDLLANFNSRYPKLELNLRGNFGNLDIAPQELVNLTIAESDTPRRITFTNKPFAVRGVTWSWNSKDKVFVSKISVAEATQGFAGTTIVIPPNPPDDNVSPPGGTVTVPPIIVPPIPPIVSTGTFAGADLFVWAYNTSAPIDEDVDGYVAFDGTWVNEGRWYPGFPSRIQLSYGGTYYFSARIQIVLGPTWTPGDYVFAWLELTPFDIAGNSLVLAGGWPGMGGGYHAAVQTGNDMTINISVIVPKSLNVAGTLTYIDHVRLRADLTSTGDHRLAGAQLISYRLTSETIPMVIPV